jgi:sugar phosphate isomerase/epimerase
MMKLSLTAWSLPSCTLQEAAEISKALGIGALDVGLFYRSALDKALILSDPAAAAAPMADLGVDLPNYYHLFGDGLEGRNLALPGTLDTNLRDLEQVLTFADTAGIETVFILPGVVNPGQSRAEAAKVSAESLLAMMALSADFDATLCIEAHVHSFAESPASVLDLVAQTGVKLALDYSHFACLGYRQDEIDPLAPHAAHVHLRQAKMGALQTKFAHGTLNFPAMFGTLRDVGYCGALAIEPVHQDYMNTLYEDVLTEIIALRDCFNTWSEGKL